MSHTNHVIDGVNKDEDAYSRKQYLDMAKDWTDPFGVLNVAPTAFGSKTLHVVRDDQLQVGSKGRFGDLLVRNTPQKTIVYVAPRVGFAGISLAMLAKRHKKRIVLFAPASKEPSAHQLAAMQWGAELRFVRIAAMPNLNAIAKEWADDHKAAFMPFGLAHPLVTAAIVKVCDDWAERCSPPKQLWSAISTGVLQRGLQIGFPRCQFHAVAVARNLKAGEAGRAHVYSSTYDFHSNYRPTDVATAQLLARVPSVRSYDPKVFEFLSPDRVGPGTWWWNVASEPEVALRPSSVDSYRDWGDLRDLAKR